MLLALLFLLGVVWCYYRSDVRYREWSDEHWCGFSAGMALMVLLGCRWHKLYYSKFAGKDIFAYRIVSVEKFYCEDALNWVQLLVDLV